MTAELLSVTVYVINVAGTKVDPTEVEQALERLPGVCGCHVDAIPGKRGGDIIRARIAVSSGFRITRADVIEHCRHRLAEYKLPRVIEFLGELRTRRRRSGSGSAIATTRTNGKERIAGRWSCSAP